MQQRVAIEFHRMDGEGRIVLRHRSQSKGRDVRRCVSCPCSSSSFVASTPPKQSFAVLLVIADGSASRVPPRGIQKRASAARTKNVNRA
jgi:hypothetical protein